MARTPGKKSHATPHADGGTNRPETPSLEGRIPLPEELTGRASGTSEDLVALFANQSRAHLTDGFRSGSEDEERTSTDTDGVRDETTPIDATDP